MSEDFRVLIVDDDFHVAKLHAAYVDSVAGFLALPPAGSASQALQAIHSLRPDLVLLDVYLPDASGLDLLHQLDVDTMILSAASDAASLRLRSGAGPWATCSSPSPPNPSRSSCAPMPGTGGSWPSRVRWTRTRWSGRSVH